MVCWGHFTSEIEKKKRAKKPGKLKTPKNGKMRFTIQSAFKK